MAIEDSVKLHIYRQAMLLCGSTTISSLTENHERRRKMDQGWGDGSELVDEVLSMAGWNHAMRSTRLEHDPNLEPAWGWPYVFAQPTDMVRIETIAADDYFRSKMTSEQYTIETGNWYAGITPIYARFVSDGDTFGMDSSRWPVTFKQVMATCLARRVVYSLTGSTKMLSAIDKFEHRAMKRAAGVDASNEGLKILPPSRWVQARMGGAGPREQSDRWS